MSTPSNAICPHCGQRAPIVLRGIDARCTVCEQRRLPFTAKTLNLAGKPSRLGGLAARAAGWSAAIVGSALALGLGLLGQTIFPDGYLGYAIGLPIAIIAWFVGMMLVFGGRKLSRSGDAAERTAQLQTLRALAAHQRGALMAHEAARKLNIREDVADTLLTELAKKPEENVRLDIDDDGGIHYLFGAGARIDTTKYRIAIPPGAEAYEQAVEEAANEELAAKARSRQ